ncbi:unnamed protein product [Larinioides sclopetarius]|uniref:Uncharacterized protein n=1 Tax=Larinioides sclopetarius TaxID=280406 RepID=A0AAV1Z3J1_9ARAC
MTHDQTNKIQELITKFSLENSKPTYTPMEPGYIKTIDNNNLLKDNVKYRQAVGALLYISTVTRPDISAAVNILSLRNEKPRAKDWEAVKRTIRYLKTTVNLKLTFNTSEQPVLRAYADSDWANDPTDRKSTSGNLFMLGNNPILWNSKRQNCITMSSAEAEYVSAASAAQEVKWLTNLFNELDMPQEYPITLFEDNQACIKLAESDKHHQKTKNIDLRYHLLKHLVEEGVLRLKYLNSSSMCADILTKALPRTNFEKLRDSIINNGDCFKV